MLLATKVSNGKEHSVARISTEKLWAAGIVLSISSIVV